MPTVVACRLECDRKSVSALVEAVKQRLPQGRLRRVQQEYKKCFVNLSRKGKEASGQFTAEMLSSELLSYTLLTWFPVVSGRLCLAFRILMACPEPFVQRPQLSQTYLSQI